MSRVRARQEVARELAGHTGETGTTDPTRLLVGAVDAAAMLGIGERTLWSLTACNAVPSYRIRRRVMYRPSELECWVLAGCPTDPGSADAIRKGVR